MTVVTSTRNIYHVPNAADAETQPMMTGELAVTLCTADTGAVAWFGSVEAVYRDGEVEDVTPEPPEAAYKGL